jgi:MFS family permease
MFMLIIWLQGIWLPRHGYAFNVTPLWAGIFIIPLTAGFLIAGPLSGILSDRYGPRPFATFGMIGTAICFALFEQVPINFSYPTFGVLLFAIGVCMSSFGSSNRTGVMNSLPARDRGAGSGMNTTFQNSAQVLSIGIFFTLIIVGLSDTLPAALVKGLTAHGVPVDTAVSISHLPPVSTLFAAFLGYNPVKTLLGPGINHVSAAQQHILLGHKFFPAVISPPFSHALTSAFIFGLVAMLIAAAASMVPDKGQPWIGRRRRSTPPTHAEDRLQVVPSGVSLEIAGADVSDDVPDGAPTPSRSAPATSGGDAKRSP